MPVLTRHFRVLRYDTRGHGESETTPGIYSIELLANDVVALLDALGLDKVHFAGLSMGGMIAQYLGAFFPDRILSLALCDTASEMPTVEMWNDRMNTARQGGSAGMVESTLKRWFRPGFFERDPEAIGKIADMIRTTDLDGYIGCASAVRDMNQTHILNQITAPTVIIVGRQDPACTLEQSQVLDAEIAQAELIVIEDAAHLSNIEQVGAFNSALMSFLESQVNASV